MQIWGRKKKINHARLYAEKVFTKIQKHK